MDAVGYKKRLPCPSLPCEEWLPYKKAKIDVDKEAEIAQNKHHSDKKYISPEGVEALCRAICSELLVYKAIVAMADNLNASDVTDAYQNLDETCGLSVDDVCGTDFHFRNVKKLKRISYDFWSTYA